jgi:hypothetical protein
MHLSIAALLSLGAMASTTLGVTAADLYRPPRIEYYALMNDASFSGARTSFMDALSTVGLVSVTGIPFQQGNKKDTLSKIHACALESSAMQEHVFEDGTIRHTMATNTIPGPGGAQKIDHKTSATSCQEFSEASDQFRKTVAAVTQAFASRLNSILEIELEFEEKPLLNTANGDYSFSTVIDVVENGEHLEHFHSYQRISTEEAQTIDIHTDQGMLIAFTPGLIIDTTQDSSKTPNSSTVGGGFFIELEDGSQVQVDFNEDDDLVFMLGDGVNQIINPRLVEKAGANTLRATPHALAMPLHSPEKEARVWYGLMVLPPADAVHPEHGMTFDALRQGLVDGDGQQEKLSLGCSSNLAARQLQENECGEDAIYCWFRCTAISDFEVTKESCAAEGLDLRCVNPRNQLYVEGHGDYYLDCIDAESAENNTAYPLLEALPRSEEMCTNVTFAAFASTADYDHNIDFGTSTFMWSIVDGMVDGRLAFDGLFGWLAFGFANLGGGHNGMNGATIIMALPGDNYTALNGLDLTLDPNVQEYIIDPDATAFRHWKDPVSTISRAGSAAEAHGLESTDCFTAITFKTDAIHNVKFNLSGTDELLWAGNTEDYYVGYHGRQNRNRFAIDWPTGKVTLNGLTLDTGGPLVVDEANDNSNDASGTVAISVVESIGLSLGTVVMVIMMM